MTPKISILAVTRGEAHTPRFLHHFLTLASALDGEMVLGCDGPRASEIMNTVVSLVSPSVRPAKVHTIDVRPNQPIIEAVLHQVVAACTAPYVLRLDDDETLNPSAIEWLVSGAYERRDVWKFNRAHLWGDEGTYLEAPQLWPDHQTRLSTREKAGGRHWIHAGSPFGGGDLAPEACAILHHKFLVRTREAREDIGRRYDGVQHGAGIAGGMRAFQLPEDVFGDRLELMCRPVVHIGHVARIPDGVE